MDSDDDIMFPDLTNSPGGGRSPSNSIGNTNHRGKGKKKRGASANSAPDLALESMQHSQHSQHNTSALTVSRITHKRDLIAASRRVNPAMTASAPAIFWDTEGNLKSSNIDRSSAMQQLVIVENGVNSTAKRLNDLKILNERLTQTLKIKLDELESTKRDFEALDAMSRAETQEAARIKQLDEDCERVSAQIAEKTHYSRRLEHVLQRLQKNQIKLSAHMNGMEVAAKGIEKEFSEVRLLRRNLDVGLGKAQFVFEETQSSLSLARRERDILLTHRKNEHRNAKMLEQRMKFREEARQRLVAEMQGGLTAQEETMLQSQLSSKETNSKKLKKSLEERKRYLASLESSFLQLSQITGVTTYDQMIEKLSLIQANKTSLEKDKSAAEDKLVASKKRAIALEKRFQELRAEGVGVAEISRESTDRLEDELMMKRSEYKMLATTSERLAAVIVGLQQAGLSLQQRVESYVHILDEEVFKLTQADDEQPWSQTLDLLNIAEQILVKMVESLSMGDNSPSRLRAGSIEVDDDSSASSDSSVSEVLQTGEIIGNNIRIYSKRERQRNELEIPVMTKAQKDKDAAHEDTKSHVVPTRGDVKKRATVSAANALRKMELEVRNKALSSRLNEGHADTGEARLRAQALYSDKLAHTTTNTLMLPEGATLRDDVMKKSECYVAAKLDHILN